MKIYILIVTTILLGCKSSGPTTSEEINDQEDKVISEEERFLLDNFSSTTSDIYLDSLNNFRCEYVNQFFYNPLILNHNIIESIGDSLFSELKTISNQEAENAKRTLSDSILFTSNQLFTQVDSLSIIELRSNSLFNRKYFVYLQPNVTTNIPIVPEFGSDIDFGSSHYQYSGSNLVSYNYSSGGTRSTTQTKIFYASNEIDSVSHVTPSTHRSYRFKTSKNSPNCEVIGFGSFAYSSPPSIKAMFKWEFSNDSVSLAGVDSLGKSTVLYSQAIPKAITQVQIDSMRTLIMQQSELIPK